MVVSNLLKIRFGHAQISVPKISIPMSKTAQINPSGQSRFLVVLDFFFFFGYYPFGLVCLHTDIFIVIFINLFCSGITFQCQLLGLYCYVIILYCYYKQNVTVCIFFIILCLMLWMSCMQVMVGDNAALEFVFKKQ